MLLFRQIHGEKRVHFMEGVLSTVLKTTGYRACLKVKTPTFIMVSTQSHMFWQMRIGVTGGQLVGCWGWRIRSQIK